LARNRYGWQKRAKEIARKEKNDEKMKRRQGKVTALLEKVPEGAPEPSLVETDLVELNLQTDS
jgi:hypothetical protein